MQNGKQKEVNAFALTSSLNFVLKTTLF